MRVALELAARLLQKGEVIAYPTETVFGLGCDVRSRGALSALCSLKGRSTDRGFSVLVADLEQLEAWIGEVSGPARRLAETFWPGPLTLVLPGGANVFPLVATQSGVGFRCSSHPEAQRLVRCSGIPLASTSCNRTHEPPARTAAEVEAAFGDDIAIAGESESGGGAPSTVVACSNEEIDLIREGALPFAQVRAAVAAHAPIHARLP